jgi:hypothetical protein
MVKQTGPAITSVLGGNVATPAPSSQETEPMTTLPHSQRPGWVTIADAVRCIGLATASELGTAGQVFQLCLDGALTLTLRLDGAKGTPWTPLADHPSWWRSRFTESPRTEEVVNLTGLFDVSLDSGGRALIEAIRWDAMGESRRGISPAALMDGRIRLVSDGGAAYALLEPAKHNAVSADAPHVMNLVFAGVYAFKAAEWPFGEFDSAEPVIRTLEVDRWLRAGAAEQVIQPAGRVGGTESVRSAETPLTVADIAEMRKLREQGWTDVAIGKHFVRSRTCVAQKIGSKLGNRAKEAEATRKQTSPWGNNA